MRRLRLLRPALRVLPAQRLTAERRARFKGLSHDEMLVFQLIQQSGNMGATQKGLRRRVDASLLTPRRAAAPGIWTKDLKIRSNLQQPQARPVRAQQRARFAHISAPQINKCLKSLEQRKLIKAVKSVASSNRKVYMLFELEPSREITGGAWCVPWRALVVPLRQLMHGSPGTPAMSTTASSSMCCGKSATSTSSARSGPRWVRHRSRLVAVFAC